MLSICMHVCFGNKNEIETMSERCKEGNITLPAIRCEKLLFQYYYINSDIFKVHIQWEIDGVVTTIHFLVKKPPLFSQARLQICVNYVTGSSL